MFIAWGSLHNFATPLAQLIRQLSSPPRYIFVNRTPLVRGETAATVQDAGPVRVACTLYDSDEFIARLTDAGYALVDQRSAPELNIHTPMRPQYSAQPCSGLHFRIRGPSAGAC
ncbi:hypothetical protein [Methylocella sp.]|uniref:hypothetical protein n=1 Tax=Methylocella sp. TaxID=1978226 RepID=UPI0037833713